jgi:hypothetical protein
LWRRLAVRCRLGYDFGFDRAPELDDDEGVDRFRPGYEQDPGKEQDPEHVDKDRQQSRLTFVYIIPHAGPIHLASPVITTLRRGPVQKTRSVQVPGETKPVGGSSWAVKRFMENR